MSRGLQMGQRWCFRLPTAGGSEDVQGSAIPPSPDLVSRSGGAGLSGVTSLSRGSPIVQAISSPSSGAYSLPDASSSSSSPPSSSASLFSLPLVAGDDAGEVPIFFACNSSKTFCSFSRNSRYALRNSPLVFSNCQVRAHTWFAMQMATLVMFPQGVDIIAACSSKSGRRTHRPEHSSYYY